MRKFGHHVIWSGGRDTELVEPVSEYRAARLPLERLETGLGFSRLDRAMEAADDELSKMPGRKVLLIFSDFGYATQFGDAEAAGQAPGGKVRSGPARGDLLFRGRRQERLPGRGHCIHNTGRPWPMTAMVCWPVLTISSL